MNYILRIVFLILTTFSAFNNFFNWLSGIKLFDYSDELLLILCFVVLTLAALPKKKMPSIYLIIVIFLVYSIGISFAFGFNNNMSQVLTQTVVNIKFFIILPAFVVLFKNHTKQLEKYFYGVIILVSVSLILHLILGATFNRIYGVSTYLRPSIRYVGIFRHPNHLAYFAILCIVLVLHSFKKRKKNINKLGWVKIILGVVVIALADTRTAMIAIVILLTAFYWEYLYKDRAVFTTFFFIGFTGLFLVMVFTDLPSTILDNIAMSYSLKSNYIRGLMFYMSLLIMVQYFPIGTGAGTFGSIFAKDSQVYKDFGVDDRYYFVHEWGIYDSNFASILGEYGIIGILLYYLLFKTSFIHLRHNLGGMKNSTMLNAFMWVFVFFCISNPMITNSVYILLSAPVFVLIAKTEE